MYLMGRGESPHCGVVTLLYKRLIIFGAGLAQVV